MKKNMFVNEFNRLAEKEYSGIYGAALDPSEDVDLYVDKFNRIFLDEQLTPYTVDDVVSIDIDTNSDDEPIIVSFKNGDSFIFAVGLHWVVIDGIEYNWTEAENLFAVLNKQCSEIKHSRKDTLKEVSIALKKADISGVFFTSNEFDVEIDEETYSNLGTVFLDENSKLCISGYITTPYYLNEIETVKWESANEFNPARVMIRFKNGERLFLKGDGSVEGNVNEKNKYGTYFGQKELFEKYRNM